MHACVCVCVCAQVTDEILEINGQSTENMLHSDAITVIKSGGNTVRLVIRRAIEDGYQGETLCSCSVCVCVRRCVHACLHDWRESVNSVCANVCTVRPVAN